MTVANHMTSGTQHLNRKEEAQWLLHHIADGHAASNLPIAFRVPGRLSWWALHQALNALVHRHPALRTSFTEDDGGLVRSVLPAEDTEVRLETLPTTDAQLHADLRTFAQAPFDLSRAPLLRAAQFLVDEADTVVCLVVHHIVFDGSSARLILGELTRLYDGFLRERRSPADLTGEAPWWTESDPPSQDVAYWAEHLRGADPAGQNLTTARTEHGSDFAGARLDRRLGPRAVEAVRMLRSRLRATDNIILVAAFVLVLHRHGTSSDLVVASPIDSRRAPEHRGTVGYHVNTVAMRVRVDADRGFDELVTRTRDTVVRGLDHSSASFESVLPELGLAGTDGLTPLFRHAFNFRPRRSAEDLEVGGFPLTVVEVDIERSRLDLELTVRADRAGMAITLIHSTRAIATADAEALLERYERILVEAAANPLRPVAQLNLATPREEELLTAQSSTGDRRPAETVLGRILRQAAATPEAIALEDGHDHVTYAQLVAGAGAIRTRLMEAGIGRADTVALALPRGVRWAAAVLAVWSLGGAFLALDTKQPSADTDSRLTEAGARVVLCETQDGTSPGWTRRAVLELGQWPVHADGALEALTDSGERDGPARVAFAPGPAGTTRVEVTHADLAELVTDVSAWLPLPTATMLWLAAPSSGQCTVELFVPLAAGGRVVTAPSGAERSPRALLDLIRRRDVAVVQAAPPTWRAVIPEFDGELRDRLAVCVGEPLPPALADRILAQGCRLLNAYGPTETTAWTVLAEARRGDEEPFGVGRPANGIGVHVLDTAGQEVPLGCAGELWLSGLHRAQGYDGQPEPAATRFADHPHWSRVHRTGSRARRTWQGGVRILGHDHGVTDFPNPVDVREIEALLGRLPFVEKISAVPTSNPGAGITVYVVAAASTAAEERVRELASEHLPEGYLLDVVLVDGIPVPTHGEADSVAPLPAAPAAETTDAATTESLAPLTQIWQRVLGRPDIASDSNFFLSGGSSLLAAKLVLELRQAFDVDVPYALVFQAQTPASMAVALSALRTPTPGTTRPTFGAVHSHSVDSAEVRAVDLALEKFIDSHTLEAARHLPAPAFEAPQTVLLTGANGYLGRFMCLDWLERLTATGGTLICIVRGRDTYEARARLDQAFDGGDAKLTRRYRQLAAGHIEVLAGDVAQERLGLDQDTWNRLARDVELITHSAALVNHVVPYDQMFGPNVVGTAELIRLAITGRIKPFTHVSTISVAVRKGSSTLAETADLRTARAVRGLAENGYVTSKWAGEILVREAADVCGLPVTVCRPGMILAHSRYSGQLNTADTFTRLLFSLVKTRIAPESFYRTDTQGNRHRAHYDGLPVEFTAEAINTLGARRTSGYRTFHVVNPHDDGISLDEFVDWLNEAGHSIRRVSDYATWFTLFEAALHALPENLRQRSLMPLLQTVRHPAEPIQGSAIPADRFREAVEELTVGGSQEIPHLSADLIVKHVTDMQQIELL